MKNNVNRRDFIRLSFGMGLISVLNPIILHAAQGSGGKCDEDLLLPEFKVLKDKCLTSQNNSFAEASSIALDGNGKAWVTWLARKQNGKEAIMVNSKEISEDGYYDCPCVACDKNGNTMVIWVSNVHDTWIIRSSVCNGSVFETPIAATKSSEGRANYPRLIANNSGGFWLVWESYKNGKFGICLKEYRKGKWRKTIEITDGSNNTYDPAVTVDRTGKVWIAYSKAENGEKNIYLAAYDPKKLQVNKEIAVCIDGVRTYQHGHPAVFCDPKDRIWIAWERLSDKGHCFFGQSECMVACYNKGQLKTVKAGVENYGGKKVFSSSNNQLPEFSMDDMGRLWLFSREITGPDIKNRRTWKIVASMLDGKRGWTPAIDVLNEVKLGRLQRPAIALAGTNSIFVAWQGDNILEPKGPRCSDIFTTEMKLLGLSNNVGKVDFEPYNCGKHSIKTFGRPKVKRRKITHNGQTYTLLFGNLHEHTNISRCAPDGADGSIDDNYRYGINVESYDFIALTDHGYDVHEVNWRKTRRAARFYTDSPHFVGLPAYEWTLTNYIEDWLPGAGHKNVIFARDKDAAEFIDPEKNNVYDMKNPKSNSPEKLWKLLKEKNIKAVTIPHHPANKSHTMDWDYHNTEYQRVVEIFQPTGSHECANGPRATKNPTEHKGCFVQDALARGYKMGFIASGDHHGMGYGLAAVFVKEVSPEGIVDALRARRCYATTGDKIFIDFSINGNMMGEEIKTYTKPRITATIDGTDKLENIVVFRDGKIILELKAEQLKGQKHYELDFTDNDFSDNSYYYLRLIQRNNEIGWSSPIWVEKI